MRAQRGPLRRRVQPVRAVAAPAAESTAVEGAWERQLPLGPGGTVTVQVAASGNEQRVVVATNRPGSLVLHWGVEGGKGYKGGWRLPGERCRPDGSVVYKQRALQTPFRTLNGNGVQVGATGPQLSERPNAVLCGH